MFKPIIAANWKMHKSLDEGINLAEEIHQKLPTQGDATVILCPPFIHLQAIRSILTKKSHPCLHLGAQNCHYEEKGAYTGEISAPQLQSLGVEYVLIGHSERRAYFQEDSQLLIKKLLAVLEQDMRPIFCCGEPPEVRDKSEQKSYVLKQLEEVLTNINVKKYLEAHGEERLVIAYEPIWAIGTGKTATPKEAEEMHAALRGALGSMHFRQSGQINGEKIPILYGGSVKPENAASFLKAANIDGLLVGGASLNASDFLNIIQASK